MQAKIKIINLFQQFYESLSIFNIKCRGEEKYIEYLGEVFVNSNNHIKFILTFSSDQRYVYFLIES